MSWSNPTPEEAAESYSYYKNRYNSAANQKRASEKQEQSYISQKSQANSQINALSSQKINFERRLRGIEGIIKMLEGSGGFFSKNVPATISKATNALNKVDNSYRKSIRRTGGGSDARLATAFEIKTVEGHPNSSNALQQYKAEKARLEQELQNLKNQLNNLSALVSQLNSKINACNATQASLQSSMNSYAYEMNHYRKYTY